MKKLLFAVIFIGTLISCKKESSTPVVSTNSVVKDTTKLIDGINFTSIGTAIGKFGNGLTDVEGNKYKTVIIGTQEWMAENLKVSKYRSGQSIQKVIDNYQWQNLQQGAWCYNSNDDANNTKYGKLYNQYSLQEDYISNRFLCPTGWHVPKYSEWKILIDYLGGTKESGSKMREVDSTSWKQFSSLENNNDATNISLFTALPGGIRNSQNYGNFSQVGGFGSWWTSDNVYNMDTDPVIEFNCFNIDLLSSGFTKSEKREGKSIRCVKD